MKKFRDEQNEGVGPGNSTSLDAIARDAGHHGDPSRGHRGGHVGRPVVGQTDVCRLIDLYLRNILAPTTTGGEKQLARGVHQQQQ